MARKPLSNCFCVISMTITMYFSLFDDVTTTIKSENPMTFGAIGSLNFKGFEMFQTYKKQNTLLYLLVYECLLMYKIISLIILHFCETLFEKGNTLV